MEYFIGVVFALIIIAFLSCFASIRDDIAEIRSLAEEYMQNKKNEMR